MTMDELRGWLAERAAGVALVAVIVLVAIMGRRERRY